MKYIVTVFGYHSDPIARQAFRSLATAERYADEWRNQTYEIRHNLSRPPKYHWSGKLLRYQRKPYSVSIHAV